MRISSLISNRIADRMKNVPAVGVVVPLIAAASDAGKGVANNLATVTNEGGRGW